MRPRERRPRAQVIPIAAANLVYAGVLTAFALTPTPPAIGATDWLLHGLAFGGLAALLHWLLGCVMPPRRSLATAAACAMGYGLVIELLQLYVPGRFFQLTDLVANGGGIAFSAMLMVTLGQVTDRLRPGAPS